MEENVNTTLTKPCPFCMEQINIHAKKCRFCGEIIDVAMREIENIKRNQAQLAQQTSQPLVINNNNNNKKPSAEKISIKHLKKVWVEYHDGILELKKRNKRTQTNRMMLMMIGSGFASMLCSLITSLQKFDPVSAAIITALPSLIIGVSIFWLMTNDNSIEEEDDINNNFARDYVCPKCGRHLGKIAYEHLPNQLTHCPKCKSEFEF